MSNPSLANQRACVEHLIALHRRSVDADTILDGAKKAALTLAWLERRAELVREIARLDEAEPELARMLLEMPAMKIADVRRIGL